jgi:hypothetical protein
VSKQHNTTELLLAAAGQRLKLGGQSHVDLFQAVQAVQAE